jgi:hypothetical protein
MLQNKRTVDKTAALRKIGSWRIARLVKTGGGAGGLVIVHKLTTVCRGRGKKRNMSSEHSKRTTNFLAAKLPVSKSKPKITVTAARAPAQARLTRPASRTNFVDFVLHNTAQRGHA